MAEMVLPDGYTHYEIKIYNLDQLFQVSKALAGNLDHRSLIESILSISLTHGQTFKVGIYLHPDINVPDFILYDTGIGFQVDNPESYRIDASSELCKIISEIPKCMNLSQLKEKIAGSRVGELSQLEKLHPELLVVPMKTSGKMNGILLLGPKNDGGLHQSGEREFFTNLASIAAIAVENARLYEMATVDSKTGLKMHHYFMNRLNEEIKQCGNSGKPLSMFISDIDHFKQFNDKYGHQTGDIVLGSVAEVLMKNCRISDIASRYGGEEFAVLLPGARLTDTVKQAERTRKALENNKVKCLVHGKKESLNVTVSIGVAQYDISVNETADQFIERCDAALYRAKNDGRNRIEVANTGKDRKEVLKHIFD